MAKRFYLPVNVVAVPDKASGDIVLKAINDSAKNAQIHLDVVAINLDIGGEKTLFSGKAHVSPDHAEIVATIPAARLEKGEFLFFSWTDEHGNLLGENDFFPKAYKYYDIPHATITSAWGTKDGKHVLTLSTDHPALFVTANVDIPGYFSHNSITLLPGRKTRLTFVPRHNASVSQADLAKSLKLRHLRQTF
jgi:beta-mannosidase